MFEIELAVSASEIEGKAMVLLQPVLRGDPKNKPQMLMWVKAYKQTQVLAEPRSTNDVIPGQETEANVYSEGAEEGHGVVLHAGNVWDGLWCVFPPFGPDGESV